MQSVDVIVEPKLSIALNAVAHWGVVITPANENFLIGMSPGGGTIAITDAAGGGAVALDPSKGRDGKGPGLLTLGSIGVVYADIAGILTTLDPLLSFVVDDWDDISPWVSALDRFVAVGTADDSIISARATLYVD